MENRQKCMFVVLGPLNLTVTYIDIPRQLEKGCIIFIDGIYRWVINNSLNARHGDPFRMVMGSENQCLNALTNKVINDEDTRSVVQRDQPNLRFCFVFEL